jgi:hypothetical protein
MKYKFLDPCKGYLEKNGIIILNKYENLETVKVAIQFLESTITLPQAPTEWLIYF